MKKDISHVWDPTSNNHIEAFFNRVLTATDTHFIYYAAEEHSLAGEECDITAVANRTNLIAAIKDRVKYHGVKIDIVFGRLLQFDDDEVWYDLAPYITYHSWPLYFAYSQLNDYFQRVSQGDDLVSNSSPLRLYALKQNKAHWHRCVLMDALAKESPGFTTDNLVTWVEGAPDYQFKHWVESILVYEDIQESGFNFNMSDPPGYFDCLFDVIPESHATRLFYTEKTFKAIALRRPFILYGAQHINKQLTEVFGFKLFPELFDYKFEEAPTLDERASLLAKQLATMGRSYTDLRTLHASVQRAVEYNFNRLVSIVQNNTLTPDLIHDMPGYKQLIGSVRTSIRDCPTTTNIMTQEDKLKEQLALIRKRDPFIYR